MAMAAAPGCGGGTDKDALKHDEQSTDPGSESGLSKGGPDRQAGSVTTVPAAGRSGQNPRAALARYFRDNGTSTWPSFDGRTITFRSSMKVVTQGRRDRLLFGRTAVTRDMDGSILEVARVENSAFLDDLEIRDIHDKGGAVIIPCKEDRNCTRAMSIQFEAKKQNRNPRPEILEKAVQPFLSHQSGGDAWIQREEYARRYRKKFKDFNNYFTCPRYGIDKQDTPVFGVPVQVYDDVRQEDQIRAITRKLMAVMNQP